MKKNVSKIQSVLLIVFILISIVPISSTAATVNVDYKTEGLYTYYIEENKAIIKYVDQAISGDVIIPESLGGYPVAEIASSVFERCENITSVIIPDSVTHIGMGAFQYCGNLISVTLPDSITTIDKLLFMDCTNLTSINIPASVSIIEEGAFYECENLTRINIPASVSIIGHAAFYSCKNLISVIIPDSVTHIGDNAFCNCKNLESVTLGDSVCIIDAFAFSGCESLTSVTIPDSVTEIREGAFMGCDNLSNITLGDSVATIGYDSFRFCYNLSEVVFPDSLKTIEESAFEYCENLLRVDFGASVTTIGDSAFKRCYKLENISFGDSVTSIGDSAFFCCESLAGLTIPASVSMLGTSAFAYTRKLPNISVDQKNPVFSNDSYGVLFDKQKTKLICYPIGNTRSTYVVPDSVSVIGNHAFFWSENLTCIAIPDSITNIEEYAFFCCENLTDIFFGGTKEQWDSITIEENNESLTNVTIHYGFIPDVPSITLNKTSFALTIGEEIQLNTKLDNFDEKPNVKWTSSNNSVATVSATGKVTAKSYGTAVITVETVDGKYGATCNITVAEKGISVQSFNIGRSEYNLEVSDTYQVYYSFKPYNATNKRVIWTSSDINVATVDNGIITAKGFGSAIITGTTEDGGFSDSIKINVTENYEKTVNIEFSTGSTMPITLNTLWFTQNNKYYNHDLAKFTSMINVLAYKSEGTIKKNLKQLGFETTGDGYSSHWLTSEDKASMDLHKNGYYITKLKYDDKTLVMVVCRGTYAKEWYSDFMPGESSTHFSFRSGATFVLDALNNYLTKNNLWSDSDVDILVTGHSRGAAVANLLASDLDNYYAYPENVYAYTYATPNVTSIFTRNDAKYNNIFNIVNPEDFVTKVLPAQWKYGRYGQTLTLPSKTNVLPADYPQMLTNMKYMFSKMTTKDYAPYKNGEQDVFELIRSFTGDISNINEFYNKNLKVNATGKTSPYLFLQSTLCSFISETATTEQLIYASYLSSVAATDIFTCNAYRDLIHFFLLNQAVGMGTDELSKMINSTYFYELYDVEFDWSISNPYFESAHLAETYCAYVYSLDSGEIKQRKGYEYTINCPVDVTVIEKESGEIVAQIVNNTVNEEIAAKENSLVASVEGDSKRIRIPEAEIYEVILTGNDKGIMDYTISTIDSDVGEISRVNYFDVPVEDGIVMIADITETAEGVQFGSVYNEYGEKLVDANILYTEELKQLDISISVNGYGIVSGEGIYTEGDYVVLEAQADENNKFLGWYENGNLISEEAQYSFVIKSSKDLTAEFTDSLVDATGIEIEVSEEDGSHERIEHIFHTEDDIILLNAKVLPKNATDKTIQWTSSDINIATINEFGIVTVCGIGEVTITAINSAGSKDEITINIVCEHSFGEYTVKKQPTCTEPGEKTAECLICFTTASEAIPVTEHKHNTVVTAPTCTAQGFTTYTCSCGDSYTADYVEAKGHSYESFIETEPGCKTNGTEIFECECGDFYTGSIPATGHKDNDNNNSCDNCGVSVCDHICHKSGFMGFIWKIINFFGKLFGSNPVCECGVAHY